MKKLRVALVGIGGYGQVYLKKLLNDHPDFPGELIAGIDPFAKNSFMYQQLLNAGIPIFDTLEEFYANAQADLVIIASPIHFHKKQAIYCMEHGSHVLCEKPVCATIDDAIEMMRVRDKMGKLLAIGYQWSFSDAIQQLKRDVLSNLYGKLIRMKTIVLWPRDFAYYHRGIGWAGKKTTGHGDWILDSVASNATAHYLHNMLYVAGDRIDTSVKIDSIEVETYRAYPIEMFDTCALRAKTVNGVEMLYLVSHAIAKENNRGPEFIYEFEKGKVWAEKQDGKINILGEDEYGNRIEYGDPNADDTLKLKWMADAILENRPIPCSVETACEHTKCLNRVSELIPDAPFFPNERIIRTEISIHCADLADVMAHCYDIWKLPGELGIPGYVRPASGKIEKDYHHFQGK